ncbi:DUF6572 domain-containing protein [Microbulbifer epialgicus]|uniref:DUF6572 domain-containing protein n=1 Tax=Microbulbifer epialgicus TaxID=393907 RepID=A0ABV4P4Q0_9GAMM
MSIVDTSKIDYIGTDERDGKTYLVVTDHLEWSGEDEDAHLEILQDKLNTYLAFIESGEVLTSFPDAKGTKLVIKVKGKEALSEKAENFYSAARKYIQDAGLELIFERSP